ncbi:Tricarboxylate transport protein TctC [Marinobacterium lacunae]|uniref:Tricarboxylate transport protein TctC n=1 Tax=Marinobacterium lacunae TaxID=1232683 RepID=A0A081FYL5_9GAMM|nr:tripartite tricarboxylate transporter substrate binding protein [Marinobacterium lacunae]KEA63620.1 Tricarboxylate transport protein TctC [Marinobacterium lacunae]
MKIKATFKACSMTVFGAVLALGALSQPAAAAEWPTKDVHLIVPYSAGGNTDVLARRVADLLQRELKANVVVENRPGAGSTVATARLARGGRDADHTILMASPGHVIGPAIYPNLGYDAVEDFRFIDKLVDMPNVMVVPASSPYNTVGEFINAASGANPMTFSHPGIGSSIHMSGELFRTFTKLPMVAVPYQGSGAALPALLGGDVDVSFENMSTVLPHIKSGGLRALAVTSPERSPFLPDVPTIRETSGYGLDGFVTGVWNGIIAHKSFPDEGVDVLREALKKVKETPEFRGFAKEMGAAEPSTASGDEFKAFIVSEIERWRKVAEDAGIRN